MATPAQTAGSAAENDVIANLQVAYLLARRFHHPGTLVPEDDGHRQSQKTRFRGEIGVTDAR